MIRLGTVFSGIGAPEFALKRLGIEFKTVLACDNGEIVLKDIDLKKEIRKVKSFQTFWGEKRYVDNLYKTHSNKHNFVKDSYLANYGKDLEKVFFQDVVLLNGVPLKNKIDLFVGGSPCQSFSSVGYQKGFNDYRGVLFFEFIRLVEEIEPRVFIYENVNGLKGNKNKETWQKMQKFFQKLNYRLWTNTLNAKDYGIPQVRNRIFVIGFKNEEDFSRFHEPKKVDHKLTMQDFLIDSTKFGGLTYDDSGDLVFSKQPGVVSQDYFLSPAVERYVRCPGTKNWKTRIEYDRPVARTLLSTMGNHHRAGVDNYITYGQRIRSLTEREALRLMGFTDDFKIAVSKAQMYKQAGNSMVVDVMMALLKAILQAIKE